MTSLTKRTTLYLEDGLHQALRLKAAVTNRSMSDLVNELLRERLAEDAEDLQAFRDRIAEPEVTYEAFLAQLQENGGL